MKNLAGVKEADESIQEELYIAGINIVKGEQSKGEVQYSIRGKLRDWNFSRAWYYWVASAPDGKGLPLEVATELHEREYPISGDNQPKTLGQVIRVTGHCGCPPPKDWAEPVEEVLRKELERFKITSATYGELAKLYNSGKINVPRFVNLYHINNQLGLNEFAHVIKTQKGKENPDKLKWKKKQRN